MLGEGGLSSFGELRISQIGIDLRYRGLAVNHLPGDLPSSSKLTGIGQIILLKYGYLLCVQRFYLARDELHRKPHIGRGVFLSDSLKGFCAMLVKTGGVKVGYRLSD